MEIVSFEISKKLKEKGFNHKTRCGFLPPIKFVHEAFTDTDWCAKNGYPAPTISQVLKWLREEKKIHIVCPFYKDKGFYYYVQRIGNAARVVSSFDDSDTCFDTAELAALAGVEYCLDNLI